jgi:hypothetical protein
MSTKELLEEHNEKLLLLADARGESLDQLAKQQWTKKKLKRIPNKFPAF